MMTSEDILAGRARAHSIAEIGEGLCLASEETDEASPADFMNHSCDPNVWMQDEVTLVARREIAADEEVTIDYALWGGFPPWSDSWGANIPSASRMRPCRAPTIAGGPECDSAFRHASICSWRTSRSATS